MREPPRVLVISTAFLGDVVFTGPLVARLVAAGWRVDALTRPGYGALLPLNGQAIDYDKRGQERGLLAFFRLARRLRQARYDLVLGAHPSVRSGLLAWLARPRRSFGWGPVGYRVRVPRGPRFIEDALELATAAGVPAGDPGPRRAVDAATLPPGTVALVPGSRIATKRWPHWAALVEALADQPRVWLGGADEAHLAVGPGERHFGRSLEETARILKGCAVAVGGDSGLLHLARAVGTPVVMLFGPTPAERLPPDPGRLDQVVPGLPCRPCSPHGPARCPLGHHRCLVDLTPAAVRRGIQAALEMRESADARGR